MGFSLKVAPALHQFNRTYFSVYKSSVQPSLDWLLRNTAASRVTSTHYMVEKITLYVTKKHGAASNEASCFFSKNKKPAVL